TSTARPPSESNITPDIQAATCKALLVSGVSAVGVRGLKNGASFGHSLRRADGEAFAEAKPAGTRVIPVADHQLELGELEWGVVPAPTETEAIVAEARNSGRPLGQVLAEVNQTQRAEKRPVRYVQENGEVVKLQQFASDLDLAYVLDGDGRPLSDPEVAVFGAQLNRAYQDLGYPVELVQHGAHFNGMQRPEIN
ncbi:MAG: hypothetical protein ACT4TC_06865, partial [Myxococcaceae bacterium]